MQQPTFLFCNFLQKGLAKNNLPVNTKVTLGRSDIVKNISKLPHSVFLQNAIDGLKPFGDTNSHTGTTVPATQKDYEKTTESLLAMFAYLPIMYFEKYRFGSRSDVMSKFSLLPPVIRYKTLDYLYSVDTQNISVIDKLVLVIMKNKGSAKAIEWIDMHKSELEKLKPNSAGANKNIVGKQDEERAKLLAELGPQNMYEVCVSKVNLLGSQIDSNGAMYTTFEEALPYYKEYGYIDDTLAEIQEFNDMMEFLYLGRKENIK